MDLTLGQIAQAVKGTLNSKTDPQRPIKGYFTDSRQVIPGGMFVAIKGEKVDGHIFVRDLLSKGCCALLEDETYHFDNTVLVESTSKALLDLGEYYRQTFLSSTKIIAITGSVGKTTTKDMVAKSLGGQYKTAKTQGNRNSQIGVPLTILETPVDTEILVLEAGMSEAGEMTRLSKVSAPDLAVITNIGHSHISTLKTRENIRDQKTAITDYLKTDGIVILNGDEPLLSRIHTPNNTFYCSISDKSMDCFAKNIIQGQESTSFTAVVLGKEVSITLPTVGLHNVQNSLFALMVAELLGADLVLSAKGLREYEPTGHRQKIYKKDGYTIIADCYNAAPESMKRALEVLGNRQGRKIAVLGDMLELGELSDDLHKEIGKKVLANHIQILITVGQQAKLIASVAKEGCETYSFAAGEFEEISSFLQGILKPEDNILLKASNGMGLFNLLDMI